MKSTIALPVILLATAVLGVYVVFIWWLDRYEREPIWLVGLVFVWGASIGVGCGCGLNLAVLAPVSEVFGPETTMGVSTVVIAPVAEEFTKGLVFLPLVWTDKFDNETDGLVYGAATGLGFATLENLLYFTKFATSPEFAAGGFVVLVAMRTLFSAVMHCISSSLLGMAIGYARHRKDTLKWIVYPAIGYGLAVVNHGLWNAASVLSEIHSGFQLAGVALVVLASLLLFGITQWSLQREHERIRRYLRKEANRGLIPEPHVDIIPYWSRRRRDDWVPDNVDRQVYVEAATLLAFRLHQRELGGGWPGHKYNEEIERYRRRIRALLS